jgi:hypothetical protein
MASSSSKSMSAGCFSMSASVNTLRKNLLIRTKFSQHALKCQALSAEPLRDIDRHK